MIFSLLALTFLSPSPFLRNSCTAGVAWACFELEEQSRPAPSQDGKFDPFAVAIVAQVSRPSLPWPLLQSDRTYVEDSEFLFAQQFLCDKRLPGDCHSLGYQHERVGNLAAAKRFYSQSCRNGEDYSCGRLARMKGVEPEDLEVIRGACWSNTPNIWRRESCRLYGIHRIGMGEPKGWIPALQALKMACRMEDVESCLFLAKISKFYNLSRSHAKYRKYACKAGSHDTCGSGQPMR